MRGGTIHGVVGTPNKCHADISSVRVLVRAVPPSERTGLENSKNEKLERIYHFTH